MPMVLVVTRNVEDRYRGFLTSVMLEVAPSVYVRPKMAVHVYSARGASPRSRG